MEARPISMDHPDCADGSSVSWAHWFAVGRKFKGWDTYVHADVVGDCENRQHHCNMDSLLEM